MKDYYLNNRIAVIFIIVVMYILSRNEIVLFLFDK